MKVSDIISRVNILLNDLEGTRWTNQELINWISDAEKLVALVRPDSSVSNTVASLVAGTKQTVPTNGFRLLDVIRNINSDGVTAGRSIRIVDRAVLDATNPNWHNDLASSTIKHFIYDNRNPLVYYVYPPASAGTKIELMYSASPAVLTYDGTSPATIAASLAVDLSISDIYLEPIVNYVMHRAYSKDAEFSSNSQLAANYLQVVYSTLGIKTQKDVAFSPDLNSKGAFPNTAAIQAGGV